MKRRPTLRLFCFVVLALAAFLGPRSPSQSQPPPPVAPNPLAPVLENLPQPVGAQRGTTLEIILTGKNLAEPTGLWTSFKAKVSFPTDKNNGKDNASLRVRLEVPSDAPLGFHSLRLATARGLSNFRLFCIDALPQVMEVDTNRSKTTPQTVPVPCVVVGRADAEISDYYKITVQAGQRVSFEVLGRRLGSAFDPQLTLYDARTGKELPGGHSEDAPGLQTDPRLTYTFSQAGDYLVEIHDTMWRGGPDFWYRLRIGDFPCATSPLPMAAPRGKPITVSFAGPTVEGVPPVQVSVPADPTLNTVWVAPRGANGLYGWPVALAISDHEELVEQEPNNEPAKANRLPVPGGITGRFLEQGDVDHFVFAAKKGQRYLIAAHTQELYSPTEVYMTLKDAKGNVLAASNPMVGPNVDITAPADGDLIIAAEDLTYFSGPSEAYRITVTPYQPSFELTLGIDRFEVPPGGAVPLTLFATRHDYGGPIEVRVVGNPNFSGQATIPAGLPPAPNQPAGTLYLTVKPDAPVGPYTVTLEGSATINGKPVVEYVNLQALASANLAGLTYPPRDLLNQVGVAVTEKPPFILAAKLDQAAATRGSPVSVTISATRAAGFVEEIALTPINPTPGFTAALKNIPKGQNQVTVQLMPGVNVPLSKALFLVNGKAKFQNKDYSLTAPPLAFEVVLPFELHTEPALLKLTPGSKAKVKVTAVRKPGFQGPILVELRNLPAQVTAPKTTIGVAQTAVDIEVTAAATTPVGNKADVNALGIATTSGNQQAASGNITVSVVKK